MIFARFHALRGYAWLARNPSRYRRVSTLPSLHAPLTRSLRSPLAWFFLLIENLRASFPARTKARRRSRVSMGDRLGKTHPRSSDFLEEKYFPTSDLPFEETDRGSCVNVTATSIPSRRGVNRRLGSEVHPTSGQRWEIASRKGDRKRAASGTEEPLSREILNSAWISVVRRIG